MGMEAGNARPLKECLLSLHNWVPSPGPPDVAVHSCNSCSGKIEAGESQLQGHPESLNQFKASLGCLETLAFVFNLFICFFRRIDS